MTCVPDRATRRGYIIGTGLTILLAMAATPWAAPVGGGHVAGGGVDEGGEGDGRPRYRMEVRLDPSRSTIEGTAQVHWTNRSTAPAEEVAVHLYLNAFRSADTVYRREGASDGVEYEGTGSIELVEVTVDGQEVTPDVRGTHAFVPLPSPLGPGEGPVLIRMAFVSKLPPIVERTGCVEGFCMAGQWYPRVMRQDDDGKWPVRPYHHNAEYNGQVAHYEVSVQVPDGWRLVGTGENRAEETASGGKRRYRFGGTLKDVAFAAGQGMGVVEGPDETGRVKIVVAHPPGKRDLAGRTLEVIREALSVLERQYAPYPLQTLVVVNVPREASGAGGMEYPGLVTAYGVDPPWTAARLRDPVLHHELAHQVFFHLLDSDEGLEPWLDEGLTTYAGLRLQAQVDHTPDPVFGIFQGLVLSGFELERLALTWRTRWPGSRLRAWDYGSIGEYHAGVYARPSVVLETIRRVYGDEPLRDALQGLATEKAGQRINSADVEEHFARVYGDGFVRDVLVPALDSPVPFNWWVEMDEHGVDVHRSGGPAIPVQVQLFMANGQTRRVTIPGDETSAHLPPSPQERIVKALLDPDRKVLLDADRLDDGATTARLPPAGRGASILGLVNILMQILGAVTAP